MGVDEIVKIEDEFFRGVKKIDFLGQNVGFDLVGKDGIVNGDGCLRLEEEYMFGLREKRVRN